MKILATILLLFSVSYLGYACDCNSIIGIKDAKSVFEGKVIGIEKIETPNTVYKIKFRISKVIKGQIKSSVIVVNNPSMSVAGCGVPFEIDGSYVVFTFIRYKQLYTSDCTETKKLNAE